MRRRRRQQQQRTCQLWRLLSLMMMALHLTTPEVAVADRQPLPALLPASRLWAHLQQQQQQQQQQLMALLTPLHWLPSSFLPPYPWAVLLPLQRP